MKPLEAQKNTQNGVTIEFKPDKIKKGVNNGNPTLRPQLEALGSDTTMVTISVPERLANTINYLTASASLNVLQGKINSLANGCFNEAYDEETGELDVEKWSKLIAGITIQGETQGELEDRLLELNEASRKLIIETPVNTPDDIVALKAKVSELNKQIQDINIALEERKEANRIRAERRKATQAANEARAAEAKALAGATQPATA